MPRVLISDKLSPAAVAIFRERGIEADVKTGLTPAELRAMLRHMRTEVEKNCDYVGADFAEEARKIHHGETEARGIFGEATEDEAEALREEGIDIARIPWVPPSDA